MKYLLAFLIALLLSCNSTDKYNHPSLKTEYKLDEILGNWVDKENNLRIEITKNNEGLFTFMCDKEEYRKIFSDSLIESSSNNSNPYGIDNSYFNFIIDKTDSKYIKEIEESKTQTGMSLEPNHGWCSPRSCGYFYNKKENIIGHLIDGKLKEVYFKNITDSVRGFNNNNTISNNICDDFTGKWVTKGGDVTRSITIVNNGQFDVQSFDGYGMTVGCRNIVCNGNSLSVTDKAQGLTEIIYLKLEGDVKYLEIPNNHASSAFCGSCKYYKE